MAGTFSFIPDEYEIKEVGYTTKINKYESGEEQRASKAVDEQRQFKLVFKNVEQSEATSIYDFYKTQRGAWDSFTWYDPISGGNVTVRFEKDGFVRSLVGYQLYNISLIFTEIVT